MYGQRLAKTHENVPRLPVLTHGAGVELRLSSTSARRVANEMDQMPLPLLGDLLEASRLEEKGRKSGQRSTHGFCPNKALRRLQGTFV